MREEAQPAHLLLFPPVSPHQHTVSAYKLKLMICRATSLGTIMVRRQAIAALLPGVETAADAKRISGRAARMRQVYAAGLPEK